MRRRALSMGASFPTLGASSPRAGEAGRVPSSGQSIVARCRGNPGAQAIDRSDLRPEAGGQLRTTSLAKSIRATLAPPSLPAMTNDSRPRPAPVPSGRAYKGLPLGIGKPVPSKPRKALSTLSAYTWIGLGLRRGVHHARGVGPPRPDLRLQGDPRGAPCESHRVVAPGTHLSRPQRGRPDPPEQRLLVGPARPPDHQGHRRAPRPRHPREAGGMTAMPLTAEPESRIRVGQVLEPGAPAMAIRTASDHSGNARLLPAHAGSTLRTPLCTYPARDMERGPKKGL